MQRRTTAGLHAPSGKEKMQSTASVFKPEEEDRIPNRAGVYAFLYNPFDRSRMGLYRGKHEPAQIAAAKIALKIKLQRLKELQDDLTLSAEFTVRRNYNNSVDRFACDIPRSKDHELWGDIHDLDDKSFLEYLEMAEQAFLFLPPLYCGMTVKQGLHSRYLQHRQNYTGEKSGTLGGRLAQSLISWSDIRFMCVPISGHSEKEASVRVLERHLINLLGPVLSVK